MKDIVKFITGRNLSKNFSENVKELEDIISSFSKSKILDILLQIGTIPETIESDSSEEKLFSKASDIVLARTFTELGLSPEISQQRGDSPDVLAHSPTGRYSLVADAKSFRLSRTAKNQKDFKIHALNSWRKSAEADYAVLVAPYFHYPSLKSQIYRQAMEVNVCLFSWETLYLLLKGNFHESTNCNLTRLWSYSKQRSQKTVVANAKDNFLDEYTKLTLKITGIPSSVWEQTLTEFKRGLAENGLSSIHYLESEITKLSSLSREEAIELLIESSQYRSRIQTIQKFLEKLGK